ncbi:MAG: hypothetical protein ACXWID_19455 [Pyrinomonadaceae bacterium]
MPKLSSAAPTFAVADVGDTIRWYQDSSALRPIPFPRHRHTSLRSSAATPLK